MAGHFATPRAGRTRPQVIIPANIGTRPTPRFAVVRSSPIPSFHRVQRFTRSLAKFNRQMATGRAVQRALGVMAGLTPMGRSAALTYRVLGLLADWGPEVMNAFGFDPDDLWKELQGPLSDPEPALEPVNLALGELAPVDAAASWTLSGNCPSAGPPTHKWLTTRTIGGPVNSANVNSCNNCLGSQAIGTGSSFTPLASTNGGTQSNNIVMATYTHGTLPNIYGTWSRYWTRPVAQIGQQYWYEPLPEPHAWPRPLPRYRPVLDLVPTMGPKPKPKFDVGIQVRPGGKPGLIIAPRRKRPGKGTKEGKGEGRKGAKEMLIGIYKLADRLGELREVMQAIYDRLPGAPKTKDPWKVMNTLFVEGRISELTLAEVVSAVVANEIEDRIIGRLNQLGDTRRLGTSTDALGLAQGGGAWGEANFVTQTF